MQIFIKFIYNNMLIYLYIIYIYIFFANITIINLKSFISHQELANFIYTFLIYSILSSNLIYSKMKS